MGFVIGRTRDRRQHHPFYLVNQFVGPRHVYPGADYLIAHWLGRYHGYVADDAPGTCTLWTVDQDDQDSVLSAQRPTPASP